MHYLAVFYLCAVVCCLAVIYLRAVDVWKFPFWGDGTAARPVSRATIAVDTDNAVGGNSATQWCCHRGHLQVLFFYFDSCMHVYRVRPQTWCSTPSCSRQLVCIGRMRPVSGFLWHQYLKMFHCSKGTVHWLDDINGSWHVKASSIHAQRFFLGLPGLHEVTSEKKAGKTQMWCTPWAI